MFIRTERSMKEFIQLYPIVAGLVIIHLVLWLMVDFLHFPFGVQLYNFGAGHNISVYHGEYWRLLTPIFLHAGLMHALFNSFALVLFGPALEKMLGKYKFIIAYLVAGLAGNIGTYIVDPTSTIPHIGASGAIYGLFGIYIFMVVFRKSLIDQANAQIVVTIFVIGLVMTFVQPGINIYAHIFGFVGGFALGPLILINALPFSITRNHRPRNNSSVQFNPNRWKKKRIPGKVKANIFWVILGVLVIFGLISKFI